ncbi:MAG: hypothetical protein V1714_05280 [Pseudomonadota bacterium]
MEKLEQKPDILKEILSGPQSESILGLEELKQLIYQISPAEKPASKPIRPKSSEIQKPKKKKTTHYLSEEIFVNLGEAKEKLKEMVPEELKTKVSKSRIVNHALEMILKEFVTRGEESLLVKKLSKRRPEKE